MVKWMKAGLVSVAGLVLVLPLFTSPAEASSKVKVLSTAKVAKQAYHGKKGNIYSSAKLTKRRYRMNHYKYTTWYAYKKATIKNNGKKAKLTYIKSGKKSGWIYSKYLTAGNAPINKQKRLEDIYVAYNKILMSASQQVQTNGSAFQATYYTISDAIYGGWNDDDQSVAEVKQDKSALLKVYALFKGRFTKSQNASFSSMATRLKNQEVTKSTHDLVVTQMDTFSSSLANQIEDLN
ncbi:hypothetical protein [Levilactobacillus yonginensis]